MMGNPPTPNILHTQKSQDVPEWVFAEGEEKGPETGESKEDFLRITYGDAVCNAIIEVYVDKKDPRLNLLILASKLPLEKREAKVKEIMGKSKEGETIPEKGKDSLPSQENSPPRSPPTVTESLEGVEDGQKDDGFREVGDIVESRIDIGNVASLNLSNSDGKVESPPGTGVDEQPQSPNQAEETTSPSQPTKTHVQPYILQVKALPTKPSSPSIAPPPGPLFPSYPLGQVVQLSPKSPPTNPAAKERVVESARGETPVPLEGDEQKVEMARKEEEAVTCEVEVEMGKDSVQDRGTESKEQAGEREGEAGEIETADLLGLLDPSPKTQVGPQQEQAASGEEGKESALASSRSDEAA